jgi:hypothetical protein
MCMLSRSGAAVLAWIALASASVPAAAGDVPAPVRTFVEKRCTDCHDAVTRKGGLDLTIPLTDLGDSATFATWVKIHDRVRAGEMPPRKKDQAPAAERDAVLRDLAKALTDADGRRQREQGRLPLRRLNRKEYENTVRDLFSLPGLQVKDLLPEDGRFDGFDKAGQSLDFSAVQLRKYLEAADVVLDAAIAHQDQPIVWKQRYRRIGGLHNFGECTFPIQEGKVDLALIKEFHRKRENGRSMPLPDRMPFLDASQSLGILSGARPSFTPNVGNFSPFHSGFYRIRTSAWSYHLDTRNGGEPGPT